MEKIITRIKEGKGLSFRTMQVVYGISILLTFTVVGNIAAHL